RISRDKSMARFSFALPILARCERPRTASVRAWRLQPGRLAQGPDEKCGMTGRTPGVALLITLSFQIESPSVGRGVPPTGLRKSGARVKRTLRSVEQHPNADADFVRRKTLPDRAVGRQTRPHGAGDIAEVEVTVAHVDHPGRCDLVGHAHHPGPREVRRVGE